MTRRDVLYRLYRLRRLIIVAAAFILTGLYLGVTFADKPGPMAAPFAILACFLISTGMVIALALRFPRSALAPLFYGIGSGILAMLFLMFESVLNADEIVQYYIAVTIIGGLVWFILAPLIGFLIIWPLDFIRIKRIVLKNSSHMPFAADRVFDKMKSAPGKVDSISHSGPVGWDGFWEERLREVIADPKTGQLRPAETVCKLKLLESGPLSQSLLAVVIKTPADSVPEKGKAPHSYVVRISVEATESGSIATRSAVMDRICVTALLVRWLSDYAQDYATYVSDSLLGAAPRAILLLPIDGFGAMLTRLMAIDESKPRL